VRAVELECQADVDVGALLSGGVDSSAIVGLASTRETGMRTYALGRDEHDEEVQRALAAAQRFGTRHRTRTFSHDQLGRLDVLIRQLGEPIALLPLTHADVLMRNVAEDGLRVVLTGNGADELLWGYGGVPRLRRLSMAMGLLDHLPPRVRGMVSRSSGILELPLRERKTDVYRRAIAETAGLLRPDLRAAALMPHRCPVFSPWTETFDGSSFAELSQFLTLMVEDAHSVTIIGDLVGMHHSVEVRSPFLDVGVVETALRLPEREKGGSLLRPEGKRVLKRGLRDVIGDEAARAPKMGFGYALQESELLRTLFRDEVAARLREGEGVGSYFDQTSVIRLLEDHLNGRRDRGKLLLSLYAFDVWHEMFHPYLHASDG
jgi:asparagine synthase (glutamine-hydrolysing)